MHRAAWKPSSIPYTDGRAVDLRNAERFDLAARGCTTGHSTSWRSPTMTSTDGSARAARVVRPCDRRVRDRPLGVAPEHHRRGLALGLCLEVAHLDGERGGTRVYVNTQPEADYVASSSAYFAAGSGWQRGRQPTHRQASHRSTSAEAPNEALRPRRLTPECTERVLGGWATSPPPGAPRPGERGYPAELARLHVLGRPPARRGATERRMGPARIRSHRKRLGRQSEPP